jgi:hypothetical protein
VFRGESKKTEAGRKTRSFGLNHHHNPGSTLLHIGAPDSGPTPGSFINWKGPVSAREEGGKQIMPLIQLVGVLIVVGVLLWLVNRFIPMAGSIKSILNAVVVICVVLWLLNVFGLFHSLSRIRVG